MIKELYNNQKNILIFISIIVFLIFVRKGGMKRTMENFENGNVIDTVLNGFDMTGQKFNNIFSNISAGHVKINKNLETNNLHMKGHDLQINNDSRKGKGTGPRRALVHDGGDTLTINYGGDYKGGVRIKSNARVDGDLRVTGKTHLKTSTYWKPGSWQIGADEDLAYLDRQNVSCNDGDFMSGIKWERSGNNMRTALKCTKIN